MGEKDYGYEIILFTRFFHESVTGCIKLFFSPECGSFISFSKSDQFLTFLYKILQSPSRVVVRYSRHTPLQWAKWQESYQTEENLFSYCLTVSWIT